MLRRLSLLHCPGALLVLASLVGCAEVPEDEVKQPPPVVGNRSKKPVAPNATAMDTATGTQGPAATAAGSGTQVITAGPAANSSGVALRDAGAMRDEDAGPSAGSGGGGQAGTAAGSGGAGGARAAAGSGGVGGTRAGGSGGRTGAAGSGGQAGGPSDACAGQVCLTVFDCWLLSGADCSYSECDNFICK